MGPNQARLSLTSAPHTSVSSLCSLITVNNSSLGMRLAEGAPSWYSSLIGLVRSSQSHTQIKPFNFESLRAKFTFLFFSFYVNCSPLPLKHQLHVFYTAARSWQ